MFDLLKQQSRGLTAKDKRRLTLSIGAAMALGAIVLGGGSFFASDGPREVPQARPRLEAMGSMRPLDLAPLEKLGKAPDLAAFEPAALRHLLLEVSRDRWLRAQSAEVRKELAERESKARATGEVTPSGGASRLLRVDDVETMTAGKLLDLPPSRMGAHVEVKGVVRTVDSRGFAVAELEGRKVFALLLEGVGGTPVLVLDGEVPRDRRPPPAPDFPADGTPPPAAGTTRPPLEIGDVVRVRGYFLQQRTGVLGSITLPQATPVLVAHDYRPTFETPQTPPDSLVEIASSETADRVLESTWTLDDFSHVATLSWAQVRGHDALHADIKSGALPFSAWERPQFRKWRDELRDTRPSGPDERVFTNESRGKVFRLSGVLLGVELEDWYDVDDNAYDVNRRWVYRMISDDYSQDAVIRFDSPFPREAFRGVRRPDPSFPQRVRIFGVFIRNHSYMTAEPTTPEARERWLAAAEKHVTVPSFVALHIAPDPIPGSAPLLENPFFWSGVALAIFALGFIGIMRVVDRREEARLHEREKRIRLALPRILASRLQSRLAHAPQDGKDGAGPGGPV